MSQTNYIIAVSPEDDKQAFKKSLEIAGKYANRKDEPKVCVLSETYKNNDLNSIAYSSVQTFKKGIRLINKKDENDHLELIKRIAILLKNGMLIIDKDIDYDNEAAKEMLTAKHSDKQDCIVHRSQIFLLDAEIEYIENEFKSIRQYVNEDGSYKPAKNIILRLHDYHEFPFKIETLIALNEYFGEAHGFSIMLAYFVARKKTIKLKQDIAEVCKEQGEDFQDFINPVEFKKLTQNYIYYSFLSASILDNNQDFVKQCAAEMVEMFQKVSNGQVS